MQHKPAPQRPRRRVTLLIVCVAAAALAIAAQRLAQTPAAGSAATAPAPGATATAPAPATPPPARPSPAQGAAAPASAGGAYTYTFSIDRGALPELYYNELTYVVQLGAVEGPAASVGGAAVPARYDPAAGTLTFTTQRGGAASISFTSAAAPGPITVRKASLKDDKAFAWSHGMDDNVMLQAQIDAIAAMGWRASLMLIGKEISDSRDEGWILDRPALHRLLAQGWSLGNHTWDHNCSGGDAATMDATIRDGQERLAEVVASSSVPDYRVITFAAPCFIADYDPYIEAQRAGGPTTLLFNESQGSPLMNVDGVAFAAGARSAAAMDARVVKIGRDITIEIAPEEAIAVLDWMAANKAPDRHFWYNTLTHGDQERNLGQVLNHAYSAYGPGGTDELWMAPSDEIYSYLLVRDATALGPISPAP